ncbi:MAG: outer membrane lipoprotein carrier protein LolA [Bacteroidia bacterium]|nr:outer membrane lipoprotein carrier protein LolA [Bacteroidia bacterium]
MIYRRLTILLPVLLMCVCASAQNIVDSFVATIGGKCASFQYNYSMSGQVPVSGSGEVTLQGDSFTMKGDGLEVYCNGTERWTVDTEAEECYIESVDAASLDYEANPALLVGAVDKAFEFRKSKSSTFEGKSVSEAVLSPVSNDGNIKEVSLFITGAGVPAGAVLTIDDGTAITISIKNWTLGGQKDCEAFCFDTKKLSKRYIITDLR